MLQKFYLRGIKLVIKKKIIEKQLEIFKSFSKIISSTRHLEEMLKAIVDLIKQLLEIERCSIFLIDEKTKTLTLAAAAGIPASEWDKVKIKIGEGIVGKVAENKTSLLVEDVSQLKDFQISSEREYTTNSFISVPMIMEKRAIGVINVNNKENGEVFNTTDLELITALASLISLAIDNSCLFVSTENFQRYLYSILENLILGVIVLDKDNKIDLYNKIVKSIFRINNEIKGVPILDIFEGSYKNKIQSAIERCIANNEPVMEEIVYKSSEGGSKSLGITVYQLRMEIAPTINIAMIIEDLSLKKEVLELRRLDEFKSNIISIVSHELRTPLTSIHGSVHLLNTVAANNLDETQKNLVNIIDRNVQRLKNLISDLLDAIHIENNTLPLIPRLIDIEPIIRNLIIKFSDTIRGKDLNVYFFVKGQSKLIFLDIDKITKVFEHLLDNAVKFTPKDGTIWIETLYEQNKVKIIFRDTGVGIDKKYKERIFDKLFQVDSTMTRQSGGTGLGLYIVRSIIEMHNGTIFINEEWEKGTEFIITLPLAVEEKRE